MNRRVLLLGGLVALAAIPTIAAFWLAASDRDDRPIVLAPSSLAPVQREIDAGLADAGIGPVAWSFAGSQSLVAQLVDGSPAVGLITADENTFEAARSAGVAWDDDHTIAENVLVLAVADGNPGDVRGLADLANPDLLIGLCAPEVPCGRLAVEATTALGVVASVDTEEASARALTTKLTTGEIDAGLIYRTDALSAGLETVAVDGLDRFPTTYVGSGTGTGEDVVAFLAGPGRSILLDAGFGP